MNNHFTGDRGCENQRLEMNIALKLLNPWVSYGLIPYRPIRMDSCSLFPGFQQQPTRTNSVERLNFIGRVG